MASTLGVVHSLIFYRGSLNVSYAWGTIVLIFTGHNRGMHPSLLIIGLAHTALHIPTCHDIIISLDVELYIYHFYLSLGIDRYSGDSLTGGSGVEYSRIMPEWTCMT